MRHPAFHVSAKLVGSVSSVTGFLRQCAGQMKEFGVVNFCVLGLSELVPEPSSATLSLLALAALAARRRRC